MYLFRKVRILLLLISTHRFTLQVGGDTDTSFSIPKAWMYPILLVIRASHRVYPYKLHTPSDTTTRLEKCP